MFLLILKGFLAGVIYALPIGPLTSICLKRTLEHGRKTGLLSFAGMAVADLLYIAIAALGYSIFQNYTEGFLQVLKYVGLFVILLIGISLIRRDNANISQNEKFVIPSNSKAFFSMLIVGIGNPVALFVFINIFPHLIPNTDIHRSLSLTALVLSVSAGMLIWWLGLLMVVNYFRGIMPLSQIVSVRRILGYLIVVLASGSILVTLLDLRI